MIPTAEEFLNTQKCYTENLSVLPLGTSKIIKQNMVEFAKLHVEAALLSASEEATIRNIPGIGNFKEVNKDSILNTYPLENIK